MLRILFPPRGGNGLEDLRISLEDTLVNVLLQWGERNGDDDLDLISCISAQYTAHNIEVSMSWSQTHLWR